MAIPVINFRCLPADLAVIILVLGTTIVTVLTPVLNQTPLRILFGLIFVLFVPGYAVIAALFPAAGKLANDEANSVSSQYRGISGIERVALSLGLSIALIPLVGLAISLTPWGIRLESILLSMTILTLFATLTAAKRRHSLPENQRFRVPYRRWMRTARDGVFEPVTKFDGVLNVLLVVSIVLTIGLLVYTVMVPPQGEQYTEFQLLTEDETGELVAGEFPTAFETGESQPLVVGIENQEKEEMTYTVVVQLQVVDSDGDEAIIEEREELDRFSSPAIPDDETWFTEHELEPTISGTELRVQYLLYQGEAPTSPTRENAYRDVHLWIDVDEGE